MELRCSRLVAQLLFLSVLPLHGQVRYDANGHLELSQLEFPKLSTARLKAEWKGQSEIATAILVGQDRNNYFFITAYHAIAPKGSAYTPECGVHQADDPEGQNKPVVTLQFFTNRSRTVSAKISTFSDPSTDLGVVVAPISEVNPSIVSIPNFPHMQVASVQEGSAVHIIGNPAGGDWSIWFGTVRRTYSAGGDIHHFETNRDQSLVGGYSGGPVFNEKGKLIGMHTCTVQSYGKALKMTEIVEQLQAWGLPTGALPFAPESSDRKALNYENPHGIQIGDSLFIEAHTESSS